MPSTYTSRIRLELQADGENPNSWGDILNQNVIDMVDDAVGAYVTIGSTGVQIVNDTALTTNNGASDQSRSASLEIQGIVVSASAANIVLPAVSKTYVVHNKVVQSSATGTLRIINTGATATGFTVPTSITGTSTFVITTDGTNVYGIDGAGIGIPTGAKAASSRLVLTSIGEIETTTVNPVTSVTATGNLIFIANTTVVDPTLLALSTTDIRYVNSSIGYANTIGSDNTFTGQVAIDGGYSYSPIVTIAVSDTSLIAVNFNSGNNFIVSVAADSTLRQPDNINVGQQGLIYFAITSAGHTLSFANDFKFSGGSAPTNTATTAVDVMAYSIRNVSVTASVTSAFIDCAYITNMTR
jgi:hypothetical protein